MNDGFSWINHGDFMRFWASKQWIRSQHLYVCWGEWDLVGGLNLPLWKMMKLPICMGKSYHKIPWFQSPSTRFLDGKPSKTHGLGKSSTMIFPQKNGLSFGCSLIFVGRWVSPQRRPFGPSSPPCPAGSPSQHSQYLAFLRARELAFQMRGNCWIFIVYYWKFLFMKNI